jgi:hypothetical protein
MSRSGTTVRVAAALRTATALAVLAAGPAGALEVTATVQPETLTVGDRAEVLLTVTGDRSELLDLAGGEPRFPAWGDRWGDAEIVEVGPVEPVLDLARGGSEENGQARLFRQRLVVTAFRPGRVALPPREIALPGPPRSPSKSVICPTTHSTTMDTCGSRRETRSASRGNLSTISWRGAKFWRRP